MAKKVDLYNVFISSPNDAMDERENLKNIIYEWNIVNLNSNIRFEPVLWELHSRPDAGKAQEVINQQLLNKSDFAISVFKNRLGQGTLEEIQLFKDFKKPIMIYFSTETVTDDVSNSFEYQKLQAWKKEVAWKEFLADDYCNVDELKNKVFKNLFKLKDSIENDEDFELTQKELNFAKKERNEIYQDNSSYDVKKDRKRLRLQARALEKFDDENIQKVINQLQKEKEFIRVLDVGCSDGYLTVSRFDKYENLKVYGIDVSKEQILLAREENTSDKFEFNVIDITEEIDSLDQGYDLIFSSYTMHHLKNSDIIISKLWDRLNENGVMMIRSPDDGLKVNFPYDGDLEYLLESTDNIAGSSDRIHGRKLYTFLQRCTPRPQNINLEYFVHDTAGLNSEGRESYFDHYYGYRNKYAQEIARNSENPDNIKLSESLTQILDQQRERFANSSEVYSLSIAILAIAYK